MAGGQMEKQVKYKSTLKDQGTPGFLRIREGMLLFVPNDPTSDSKLEMQTQNIKNPKYTKEGSNKPHWLNLTNKQGRSHIFEFENYSEMHVCRDFIKEATTSVEQLRIAQLEL